MVFTLASHLRETLSSVVARRVVAKQAAEDARHAADEEAAAARLRGTAVTAESFLAWKAKFVREEKASRIKEAEDRIKALPAKEREEVKKARNKLTGEL